MRLFYRKVNEEAKKTKQRDAVSDRPLKYILSLISIYEN